MSRERVRIAGAERRTDPSPFGDQGLREEWSERVNGLADLASALAELIAWRDEHAGDPVTDQDALWIEARLEEKVSMLRFDEKTNEEIRTLTLTGEAITAVQGRFIDASKSADSAALEALAADFRRRFKPPVMPSSPFLRTEMLLSEQLMKTRSKNWFDPSIKDLRRRRGVAVFKEGWPETATSTSQPDAN